MRSRLSRLPAAALWAAAAACVWWTVPVAAGEGPDAGPPRPPAQSLTVEQIAALLRTGAPREQITRRVGEGPGGYRLTDEQYNALKAAGAPPELLDLLTGEKSDPITETEVVELAKRSTTDGEKARLVRHRRLAFALTDDAKFRLLTAASDKDFTRNMEALLLILARKAGPGGRVVEPAVGEPGAEPLNPGVVVRDWTFEIVESGIVQYTFTLENQLPHGVRNLRVQTTYMARFSNVLRPILKEDSADLGELEAFERRRFSKVRLHRSRQPGNFADIRFDVFWEKDEREPTRFVRHSPRDVERALRIGNQVWFVETSPFPEMHHRFTLINQGGFAIRDAQLLLKVVDAAGRPLWYHEHSVGKTLMPGDVVRGEIGSVPLGKLWDRSTGAWADVPGEPGRKLEPAGAELVLIRGFPVPVRDPEAAGTLGTVALLEVVPEQSFCSWIDGPRKPGGLQFFHFTVVNRNPHPVKDVTLLVWFRDQRNRPVNYEVYVTLPGVIQPMQARRFERVFPDGRYHGLITEGDRAASYSAAVLSAVPAPAGQ